MDVVKVMTPTFQAATRQPIAPATLARYIAHTKRAQAAATTAKDRFLLELQLTILENMAGSAAPNPPVD